MIAAYHQPEALDAALDFVAKGAIPVAGATGLYSGRGRREVELVDVTRLGLDAIKVTDRSVTLGATVTLGQLSRAVEIPTMVGAVLRKAARGVASTPLRNAITLGGNVAHLVYWADMPVVLLGLDASVEIRRAGFEPVWRPLVEVMHDGKKAWDGGLITSIQIAFADKSVGFGYERFTRTASDYAFASACVTMGVVDGKARDVRTVLGAVQSRPGRLADVEAMIEGQEVDAELLTAVEEKVNRDVRAAPNFRAPADYRRHLGAVLMRRAVGKAWSWASREDG